MTGFRRSRSPWQRCNAFSITVRQFWLRCAVNAANKPTSWSRDNVAGSNWHTATPIAFVQSRFIQLVEFTGNIATKRQNKTKVLRIILWTKVKKLCLRCRSWYCWEACDCDCRLLACSCREAARCVVSVSSYVRLVSLHFHLSSVTSVTQRIELFGVYRLPESTPTIAIYYYYSARKLIHILPSHRGQKAEST